jgi:3-deoxy-manno-octulosonate cytidylyltransferase (CMP-KDO synthetase)
VQGDEPLIDPALIRACAGLIGTTVPMATVAHAIDSMAELLSPHVVKVVLDAAGHALLFSRAPVPWHRDGFAQSTVQLPAGYVPLRHVGLYAYRQDFLQTYPALPVSPLETIESLEQLRVLWHGHKIAVHVTPSTPPAGVDTAEDLERVRREFVI